MGSERRGGLHPAPITARCLECQDVPRAGAIRMHRVWGLRVSLSAYDATDVAPAEALGATLLRWDDKLARVHEHAATIALVRIDS